MEHLGISNHIVTRIDTVVFLDGGAGVKNKKHSCITNFRPCVFVVHVLFLLVLKRLIC